MELVPPPDIINEEEEYEVEEIRKHQKKGTETSIPGTLEEIQR